jgi:hypothetical protein
LWNNLGILGEVLQDQDEGRDGRERETKETGRDKKETHTFRGLL